MNDRINDEILIEIDGQMWTAFESISVTKSMQNLCGIFNFRMVKEGEILPFSNGSKIRILIGNNINGFETILNGFIEKMTMRHNAASHYILVSGRDKTADFLDSTIAGNFTFKAPISLISLTQKVLKKIGINDINVKIDVNVNNFTADDLKMGNDEIMSSYTGERVFDFISRYARKKQVLLTTDNNGDLLFTRTSNKAIATKLFYKNFPYKKTNILSGEGIFDISKRYYKYNCYSQYNSTNSTLGAKGVEPATDTKTIGSAIDDEVRHSRVFNFIGSSPYSDNSVLTATGISGSNSEAKDDSKKRAIWEANVRRAKSIYYIAEVVGYRAYEDNIIWKPNLLVEIEDDDAQINSQLLLNEVTYSKNLTSGSITSLNFVSKDTFDLLEITGRTSRKKASERVEGRKFAG